jgi:Rrf2 family protein
MKLSVKSEYACLALITLAEAYESGELYSITRIAESKDIPKKYLEQILLILKYGGYVRSHKGPKGGYKLAKSPDRINIAEIIRLMDGALAPVESVSTYFFEHTPIEKSPKLLEVFRDLRNHISETLEQVTLDQLIE